jgi:hypothetical protein
MDVKHECRNQIEERRPRDSLPGGENTGRDDGGDGVRGIMEPIEEIEDKRQTNGAQNECDHVRRS